MLDPHAISELYQHIITAVLVLGPTLGALLMFWWKLTWRLGRIDYKISVMWKAFCRAHNLEPNGD